MRLAGRDFTGAWQVCNWRGRARLLIDTAAWYAWRKWRRRL